MEKIYLPLSLNEYIYLFFLTGRMEGRVCCWYQGQLEHQQAPAVRSQRPEKVSGGRCAGELHTQTQKFRKVQHRVQDPQIRKM